MGKLITCPNCGAEFDEELTNCPYCGSTNIKGAEKEYFKRLEGVRQDMEDLHDDAGEAMRYEAKRQGKKLWILFLVLGIFVLLIIGLIMWVDRPSTIDYKESYAWKAEHFPELDALYEAEDYNALLAKYYELIAQKGNSMYEWEHCNFISDYASVYFVMDSLRMEKESGSLGYSNSGLFTDEWMVKGLRIKNKDEHYYTDREWEVLLPGIEVVEKDFDARWHMSPEDYDRFYESLVKYGGWSVDYEMARDYIKKWEKENQ